MTFKVIDKETGNEVADDVIYKIAKNGGLLERRIEQFFVGEDGSLILIDVCGNITYCVQDAFEIQIESED